MNAAVIRMYGETVQLNRYKITYSFAGRDMTAYAVTEEEAQAVAESFGGTYEGMDVTGAEWMEGLTFPTRDDAIAAMEAGEEAYKAAVQKREAMSNERLREDVDRAMEAEGRVSGLETAIKNGLNLYGGDLGNG